MPNNLFNTFANAGITNPANDLMGQLNALKSNPVQFLAQRRLNLPQNFSGGPKEIVQYLLNSGQIRLR